MSLLTGLIAAIVLVAIVSVYAIHKDYNVQIKSKWFKVEFRKIRK